MPSDGTQILIVDDPARGERLASRLREAARRVVVTPDELGAVACVQAGRADIVLLALDAPGVDIDRLIGRLTGMAESTDVPVVVLVPQSATERIDRCLTLGATDYLQEPFSSAMLRLRLDAWDRDARERANLKKMERFSDDLQRVILPLGVQLSIEKNVDRLLERILLEAKALCHADAGTLYIRTKDDRLKFDIMLTDSLHIALGGTTGREIPFPPLRLFDAATGAPNHHNVATHVALEGRSVNIPDIYQAKDFDFSATKVFDQKNRYRSISTLTVPLKDNADQVIAVLQLLNALDPATGSVIPFDAYQQLVVESLASQAAVAFSNQLLLQRQQELLSFERDLQIGRQIQAGFLPTQLPTPPGWEIAARFRPAREVAGDFYDAFPLNEHCVGLVIADVCDKGVGAALFMALVRSLLRAYAQQRFALGLSTSADSAVAEAAARTALQEAVALTNGYIGQNHYDMNMFATVFAGVLDPATGLLAYVNGGHNPPVIYRGSEATAQLTRTGPAVGMLPQVDFEVRETRLEPGDLLFAFTDGATDARDPHGAFFSEARLLALAGEDPDQSAASLLARVDETLMAHISTAAQYDDITLLAVRRVPIA